MTQPKVLLIVLRDRDDPMAAHERLCFAQAAQLSEDAIDLLFVQTTPLSPDHLRTHDAFFFGGSGAYSVLDDLPWMPTAFDSLQRVLDAAKPAWASCFGFQAVAKALGGRVIHDEARTEMGAVALDLVPAGQADPLVGHLPAHFWVQEGHHDHVLTLPPDVTRLARGASDVEQLFRVDGTPFYASQFHPELDVAAVVHRFEHYRAHYHDGDPADFDAQLAAIQACRDTPEVGALLARLVRGGWA